MEPGSENYDYTFNQYQDAAAETAIYPKDKALEYVLLGLGSEVGELQGKFKKVIRDNGGVFTPDMAHDMAMEAGDCLWYLANFITELSAACPELDTDFEYIAKLNIWKLQSRKERGVLGGSGDTR